MRTDYAAGRLIPPPQERAPDSEAFLSALSHLFSLLLATSFQVLRHDTCLDNLTEHRSRDPTPPSVS